MADRRRLVECVHLMRELRERTTDTTGIVWKLATQFTWSHVQQLRDRAQFRRLMELKHHRDESKLVPLAHGALWRAPWTWIQPGLFLMLLALADHQGQL